MKRTLSKGTRLAGFLLSMIVLLAMLFPAHAAPTDAQALRTAHKAYFDGFPRDRTALLALGQQGNHFAAMMLKRTWQRPSYGPVSESEAGHWRGQALAAGVQQRLQALAGQGDATAMTWLGSMYRYGLLGVAEDLPQSASWYRQGAEKGNTIAQRLYAEALVRGDGLAKDEEAGYRWNLKAAAQGDTYAQFALGYAHEKGQGVPRDAAKAVAWYRKAADQGNEAAQSSLAWAYSQGNGVPRNDALAASWYRKLAERGDPAAQYNLGASYWHGKGVAEDRAEAAVWIRKAAAQGYASAQDVVGGWEYDAGNHCAMIDAWEAAAPSRETGQTHANLALQYRQLGNLVLARDHARRAVAKGGLDADLAARMGKIIESTEHLRHIDASTLAWSGAGDAKAAGYQAIFDAVNDKAYVTHDQATATASYVNYLYCGPSKDLLIESGGGSTKYSMTLRMLYRFDTALGVYRAFPLSWTSGAAPEVELTVGRNGQLLTNTVEFDSKGRRQATHLGRSELMVMRDGTVRQLTPAGIITSKMKEKYAVLIPRQGAADVARRKLGDMEARKAQVQQEEKQKKAEGGGGLMRTLAGAAVGATMMAASGAGTEQVLGGALKGAEVFNSGSATAASLGATGEALLGGPGTSTLASGVAQAAGAGSYPTRPNLATSACAGFTEGNYRQKALSGGGDQQLYTMCGQAFEYYTMYKRAIAQGYSEADANRTYAAHQQSTQVAQGYLQSHGAN